MWEAKDAGCGMRKKMMGGHDGTSIFEAGLTERCKVSEGTEGYNHANKGSSVGVEGSELVMNKQASKQT